ncbi:nucleotide-diphospho-sugar transferase [Microthyrium microscopicum]|uniref:glycogenin glucosyltransferase n=1 Tax=Microthyrium microscopicum TaxID=703497 RepID=A0A6A6U8N4_9PEZI|nr:nucleotide-diphospho-sugar transferase [Microthyrium microscopicum]
MGSTGRHCYMTLVMSDSYLPGAMVLGHSLKDAGATKDLVALVTLETLSIDTLDELKTLYEIVPVARIPNTRPANLYLMGRPDLLYAFTKIGLWRQTQYSKIVYMDADMVALRNLDDLFYIDAGFAAAPDVGWPDAFNSGLMVLTPSMGDYWALQSLASSGDSFDGADQGLLNQYYEHKPWHRLSFTYNCTPNAEYQWEPAYRYHKSNIKAVHFIGRDKPWFVGRQGKGGKGTYGELIGKWWSVYDKHYRKAPTYVPGKSYTRSTAVQERVFGEHVDMYYGVPENERLPPPSSTDVAPAIAVHQPQQEEKQQPPPVVPQLVLEQPTPSPDPEPQYQQEHHQPPPPFQPPEMEWDATRSAPPSKSRPEAEYFPTAHYTFEDQKRTFKAPRQYPQPPPGMWYETPTSRAPQEEPPKAIFPWETKPNRPTTTRVFAEDYPPSPQQEIASPQNTTWEESSGGMERYIRNIMSAQHPQPKKKHLAGEESPPERRESLVISGFPALDDRPSLPVTPAPMMSSHFWGDDEESAVPPEVLAEQTEWNPELKLEELRRNSLVEVNHLVKPTTLKSPSPLRTETSPTSAKGPALTETSTEKEGSSLVATLESAAERQSSPPATTEHANPKVSFSDPKYVTSPTSDGSQKSPGSFSSENLHDSAISPTER